MFTPEKLFSIDKNDIPEVSKTLGSEELQQLAGLLSEKDDKIRYQALLLLQHRSMSFDDVYPFWDLFCEKLKSDNSYQRSIGLILISENVKWDWENKFEKIFDDFFARLNDDKPITIRQCIQSLQKVIPYKKQMHSQVADRLIGFDISGVKETMRKVILLDALEILAMIRKQQTNDRIENYISNALNSGLLDKKAVKQVKSMIQ